MAVVSRRGVRSPISMDCVLATADDLDGTTDGTQAYDVTNCDRAIIAQINNGTLGTAGIDVIEVSHDGGDTWAADDTLLAVNSNDATGAVIALAALNAAGVEPTGVALFKSGPYSGTTAIRCGRKTTTTTGTTWVTGAPTVKAWIIGGSAPAGAGSTLA